MYLGSLENEHVSHMYEENLEKTSLDEDNDSLVVKLFRMLEKYFL